MSKHVACGLSMSNFQPEDNVVMVVTFAFTERTAKKGYFLEFGRKKQQGSVNMQMLCMDKERQEGQTKILLLMQG